MMSLLSFIIMVYHFTPTVCQQAVPKPAIRVRFNKGVFEQASTIVAGLVEYEGPRIKIPSSQQCFPEGCVQIHSLSIASFRQPTTVSFQPYPPNRFLIRLIDFDFFVTGQLSGSIFLIIQLPVFGTVYVSGLGVTVSAYMDIQKTSNDEPYFRMLSCNIDSGIVEAKVANMGLLTDTVNFKYRDQMSAHSRAQLEMAICENIYRITQQHFSSRLYRLPRQIHANELFKMFLSSNNKSDHSSGKARFKRFSDDYYDDSDVANRKETERTPPSSSTVIKNNAAMEKSSNGGVGKILFTNQDITHSFDVNRLQHVMIDLTLLDASASHDDFSVGMSGSVSNSKTNDVTPYKVPFPFRLPQNLQRRMIEVVISAYSINSMLYHAHKTNSLMFRVDSHTPGVGQLLRTTCSLDEVCLSDQIEEVGEAYPDKNMELIIRTTSPPVMSLEQDTVKLSMNGVSQFFLEGTKQQLGVIPFSAEVHLQLMTVGSLLKGRTWITNLAFNEGIDFFNLTSGDLDGFRKTTQKALENIANSLYENGIPLSASPRSSPLRLSAVHLSILPNVMLLQANIDLYNSLYNHPN